MARKVASSRRRSPASKRRKLFLPWPAIVFLMLSVGVLLIGWTFVANAGPCPPPPGPPPGPGTYGPTSCADIRVTAEVHASLPSGPATIISPTDGQHFNSIPITVTGTCPSDGSGKYIKLFRNNVFSGTAICSASNQFSLQSDLFADANLLKAIIYNTTDDAGPASNMPTVFYDVPVAAKPLNPQVPPFLLSTDFKITGYQVGQNGEWKLVIVGGTAPYAINIQWGDGTSSLVSRTKIGEFTVSHAYKAVGNHDGSTYTIKINGSDGDGNQAFLQLFVIVNPSHGGVVTNLQNKLPPKHWLLVAWPLYLIVLLMMFSFWLGEREELLVLRKRGWLQR